jgi:hypothetical protein
MISRRAVSTVTKVAIPITKQVIHSNQADTLASNLPKAQALTIKAATEAAKTQPQCGIAKHWP